MQDYISNIPAEIFELILAYLNGVDLSKLKQANKKFKKSLENPTAYRLIFNEQFKSATEEISFIDDDINWNEEMNLISFLKKKKGIVSSKPVLHTVTDAINSVRFLNDSIIVNNFAPVNIQTCLRKRKLELAPLWHEYLLIGPYAGRIKPDQQGCHQFYDIFDKKRMSFKKLFETTKSTLISFNKSLAVLKDEKTEKCSVWNLNIQCKHTEEVLWKRSTKKTELCKECSYVCTLEHNESNMKCSEINQKLILIPKQRSLHVIQPLKGSDFVIEWSDDTKHIDAMRKDVTITKNQSIVAERPSSNRSITDHIPIIDLRYNEWQLMREGVKESDKMEEKQITVDGKVHHIVHCIINEQHRFYDLTVKKLIAVIDCWPVYKCVHIHNTCNIAIGGGADVVIIDIYRNKIISKFRINRGWNEEEHLSVICPNRSGTLLLIGQTDRFGSRVLLYSAVTGAYLARIFFSSSMSEFNLDLSADDKTLIAWNIVKINVHDLKDSLSVSQRRIAKKKRYY